MASLSFLLDLLVAVGIAVRYPSPTVNLDTNKVCMVYIKELRNPEPLFLNRDIQLWYPNGPVMVWKGGESTLIACPGKGNKIVNSGSRTATITCLIGTIFTLNGPFDAVNIYDVKCKDDPRGSVQNTRKRCGGGYGTLLNVGFDVLGVGFVPYFRSCYDMVEASVIYTRHVIDGAAINYRPTGGKPPLFNDAEVPRELAPRTAYTQEEQESRFTQLLGSEDLAKYYIEVASSTPSILTRGHLTPAGDGIFRSWRWATYFYVNAAPQWQATNGGNWEVVEDAARTVSVRLKEEVLVFTGAHDILILRRVDGLLASITLKDDKIQVPKRYWKVIKSPRLNAAIALVSNNNPFSTSTETLCDNVCNQYGWFNELYSNFSRGYTYCCTVADLRVHIPSLPAEANAANVLRYDYSDGNIHDELR